MYIFSKSEHDKLSTACTDFDMVFITSESSECLQSKFLAASGAVEMPSYLCHLTYKGFIFWGGKSSPWKK